MLFSLTMVSFADVTSSHNLSNYILKDTGAGANNTIIIEASPLLSHFKISLPSKEHLR